MTEQHDVTQPDADSELIRWLLDDSGVSRYRISKDTGVSEGTLSRIHSGNVELDSIRFGYAKRLTTYARDVRATQTETQSQSEGSHRT